MTSNPGWAQAARSRHARTPVEWLDQTYRVAATPQEAALLVRLLTAASAAIAYEPTRTFATSPAPCGHGLAVRELRDVLSDIVACGETYTVGRHLVGIVRQTAFRAWSLVMGEPPDSIAEVIERLQDEATAPLHVAVEALAGVGVNGTDAALTVSTFGDARGAVGQTREYGLVSLTMIFGALGRWVLGHRDEIVAGWVNSTTGMHFAAFTSPVTAEDAPNA